MKITNTPLRTLTVGTTFTLLKDYTYDTYDNFIYDDYGDYEPDKAKEFLDKHPELIQEDMIVFPKGTKFEFVWFNGSNASTIKSINYDVELPMNLDYFKDDMEEGIFEFDTDTLEDM